MKQSDLPEFYRLDEYTFQELCRDLFEVEAGIATCSVFGKRGEKQYGIDLYADRKEDDAIEVGQCKCYENLQPFQIQAATRDFFKHWNDYWSTRNVVRFVLFVASDLENRTRKQKIEEQRRIFGEYGIKYEVWSASTIRNKLRGHPGIVATYLPRPHDWVHLICGRGSETPLFDKATPEDSNNAAIGLLAAQFNELAAVSSRDLVERIEQLRAVWRAGNRYQVADWIEKTKTERWQWLSSEAKVRLLCLEAGLALDNGEVEQAKLLAVQAEGIGTSERTLRLRALIAFYEGNLTDSLLDSLRGLSDIDSRNLLAALLLDTGRQDEANVVLQAICRDELDTAETQRLLALSYLAHRESEQARMAAEKALASEPDWVSTRLTSAIVNYYSAVAEPMLPERLAAWPVPLDWTVVKRDSDSLTRLARAANDFGRVASESQGGSDEQTRLLVWRLAALANHPGKQEEAMRLGQKILLEHPGNYPAIVWTTARNWAIDLSASETSLQRKIDEDAASIADCVALLHCYHHSAKSTELERLLESTHVIFEAANALNVWRFWETRALVAQRRLEEARAIADTIEDSSERFEAQALVLKAQADESRDSQALSEHFLAGFDATDDPLLLLAFCETKAQANDWAAVAEAAFQLVGRFSTAEVARLAAIALHHAGHFEECLDLLDNYGGLFMDGRLPRDLRQMRIACLSALGLMLQAISEAESLSREDPAAENLLNLAKLYFTIGDTKQLAVVARSLAGRVQVGEESLLIISQLIMNEDPSLATDLWRMAVSGQIGDNLVVTAVLIGFGLGLEAEEEMKRLQARMAGLGEKGGATVFVTNLADLNELLKKRSEQASALWDMYSKGEVPIHLVAEQVGFALSVPFHQHLTHNAEEPDPIHQEAVFARHGGRWLTELHPRDGQPLRLNLDLTAVLLAEHLGILDAVARVFSPLRVPRTLPAALLSMEQSVKSPQPERVNSIREVLRLVDEGRLSLVDMGEIGAIADKHLAAELGDEWAALYAACSADAGFLACFLPPPKAGLSGANTELPADSHRFLLNAGDIARSLLEIGAISQAEYELAITRLGSEGITSARADWPRVGAKIYCLDSVALLLAASGLLNSACSSFRLVMTSDAARSMRKGIWSNERTEQHATWLRTLREKIRLGIENSSFQLLPILPESTKVSSDDLDANPGVKCLLELFGFTPSAYDIVWSDDRYINAFLRKDTAPIIGVSEILAALRAADAISGPEYYDALLELRSSNIRYLPMGPDEVDYHLKQARIEDEVVVESKGLRVIRQYLASCLYQGNLLQRPTLAEGGTNPYGEMAFVSGSHRTAVEALVRVWQTYDADPKGCLARAEWLWAALVLDLASTRKMVFGDQIQDDLYLVAAGLADLIVSGYQIVDADGQGRTRRAYFDWLFTRPLWRKLHRDPPLVQAIAGILKNTFRSIRENKPEAVNLDTWNVATTVLLQRYFDELPQHLQAKLRKNPEFVAELGIEYQSVLGFSDLVFARRTLLEGLHKAVNGSETVVTALNDPSLAVTLRLLTKEDAVPQVGIVHPTTGEKMAIMNEQLALLGDSLAVREAMVKRNAYWIDLSDEDFQRFKAEVVSHHDPVARVDAFDEQVGRSLTVFYRDLESEMARTGQIAADDLLPTDHGSFLRYLRLLEPARSGAQFDLDSAATILLDELGVFEATARLVGIPVPLPQRVIEAATSLSDVEKRCLVKGLLRTAASPIGYVHTLALVQHFETKSPVFRKLAKRMLYQFASDNFSASWDASSEVLRWVNERLATRSDVMEWSTATRLAVVWLHAHRLFCIFCSIGVPPQGIHTFFGDFVKDEGISFEVLDRDFICWDDVAHPRRVSRFGFLLQSVGYALQFNPNVIDDNLRRRLDAALAPRASEGEVLDPAAFRDPVLANNALGAFLGRDYADSFRLVSDLSEDPVISHVQLRGMLDDVVWKQLQSVDPAKRTLAWARLSLLLGDLRPPDESLMNYIRQAIEETDFTDLLTVGMEEGLIALRSASSQLAHFGDADLNGRMESHLLSAGRVVSKSEDPTRQMLALMLDTALNLAIASTTTGLPAAKLAVLLDRLADSVPGFLSYAAPLIRRLYEELPTTQGIAFARLYLRVRCSME